MPTTLSRAVLSAEAPPSACFGETSCRTSRADRYRYSKLDEEEDIDYFAQDRRSSGRCSKKGIIAMLAASVASVAGLGARYAGSSSGVLLGSHFLRSGRDIIMTEQAPADPNSRWGAAAQSFWDRGGVWLLDGLLAPGERGLAPGERGLAPGERGLAEGFGGRWESWYEEFYRRFNKSSEYTYSSPEYYRRFDIFKANAHLISEHNERVVGGRGTGETDAHFGEEEFILAPNQFMDLTWREFRRRHLQWTAWPSEEATPVGLRVDAAEALSALGTLPEVPESVNWADKGCVTAVKNQGHCGSCWAFSSTGALEGAICARTGQLPNLSEQQLVDCAKPEGTHGCSGGFMDNAFQYVIDNGGLCSEDDYPYEGIDAKPCRADNCQPKAYVHKIMDLPPHDADAIKAAVAIYGPVAVAVEADRPVFQFYHKGVMSLKKCGKHLDHAVLLTGYGSQPAATADDQLLHYWLIKNSWGPTWGEEGFIKLSRDVHTKNGQCGVLLVPTIPIVELRDQELQSTARQHPAH